MVCKTIEVRYHQREQIFSRLIKAALDAQNYVEAFTRADQLMLVRRRDAISTQDVRTATYGDRRYVLGLNKRLAAWKKALTQVVPDMDESQRRQALLQINRSKEDYLKYRDSGGRPSLFLRRLVTAQTAPFRAIQKVLHKKQGLLFVVYLESELVAFLVTPTAIHVHRQEVLRTQLKRLLTHLKGKKPERANQARRVLSEWLLLPFEKVLTEIDSLIAVTDDQMVPVELLIQKDKPLFAKVSVNHFYSASDVVLLSRLRNLNIQRALWIGQPGPSATSNRIKSTFPSLKIAEPVTSQISKELETAGVVIWNVTLVEDEMRPMRSGFVLQPEFSTATGVSLRSLMALSKGAGIWLLGGNKQGIQKRLTPAALELALASAQVPCALVVP